MFVGGCTLEAAEAVCGRTDPAFAVLVGLKALATHSLVQIKEDGAGAQRMHMLETIREYALERLAAAGEHDCGRTLTHYCAQAEYWAATLEGPRQSVGLDQMEREHDNLRAALA